MTKRKLNWGTFRKKFPWVKILSLRGKFLSLQKCHFLTLLRKIDISLEIRSQIKNGVQIMLYPTYPGLNIDFKWKVSFLGY
jgi:hypothetical protein